MAGLWRKKDGLGKYLIVRRDGTMPEWPSFVLGARDPHAPGALRDYADRAEKAGEDPEYVADVREMADEFEKLRAEMGPGDPSSPKHRKDDPCVLAAMSGLSTLVPVGRSSFARQKTYRTVFKATNLTGGNEEKLWEEVSTFLEALHERGGMLVSVQDRSTEDRACFVVFYETLPEVAGSLPQLIEKGSMRSSQPSVQNLPKTEEKP